MADPVAKPKRRRVVKKPPDPDPANELAESIADECMVASSPTLETADQQRQRKKLEVMRELEDFRASFTRGYAVILAELAKKR